jgi:hypothetical protein
MKHKHTTFSSFFLSKSQKEKNKFSLKVGKRSNKLQRDIIKEADKILKLRYEKQ